MILAVGPGVLIPRPETELLIDLAQQVSQSYVTFLATQHTPGSALPCFILHRC